MNALRAWWKWLRDLCSWWQEEESPLVAPPLAFTQEVRVYIPPKKKKPGRPKGWFAALSPEEQEATRARLREAAQRGWASRRGTGTV